MADMVKKQPRKPSVRKPSIFDGKTISAVNRIGKVMAELSVDDQQAVLAMLQSRLGVNSDE